MSLHTKANSCINSPLRTPLNDVKINEHRIITGECSINQVSNLNQSFSVFQESDKRKKKTFDDEAYAQEIRGSILSKLNNRSFIITGKKNLDLRSSNNNDSYYPKLEQDEDFHWPEAFMDALDKPIQQIEAPDVIYMHDCLSTFKFTEMNYDDIWRLIEKWKFLNNHDDVRIPAAYKAGGKRPEKEIVVKKLRIIAKELIMNIGRKLLSGNFNLTTVSFPIKAMVPKSQLENISLGTCYFPLYMNLAAQAKNHLQRFKYYIVASISYYYLTNSFAKPLNPILGETMHGYYNDGSKVFLEQTSHHPPISYILMYGQKNSYKYYGPSIFSASAGLNSLTLHVKGWRKCVFNNPPQEISNTFPDEKYDGTFFGDTTHETVGSMEFIDKANGISCEIKFGKIKKKQTDYFESEIKVRGRSVSKISGTYLGWIEIDGERYFDYRFNPPFQFFIEKSRLGSDFAYRPDLYFLEIGNIAKAQKEKETLEHIQRTDAKLRKMHLNKMHVNNKH